MAEKVERILIDTSTLVKGLLKEKNYEAVENLLQMVEENRVEGIISSITICELIYILNRKNRQVEYECVTYIENSKIKIVDITKNISKKAGELKIKYADKNISVADALIIATAIENEIDLVVTADRMWAEIPEIKCKIV